MQKQNSQFYYLIDIDDDSRLRNVFWADARSRAAYEYFGQVVTFDTTYLTNKYDMPFAPFVGVNHHGQSMLLGCALLSNEDRVQESVRVIDRVGTRKTIQVSEIHFFQPQFFFSQLMKHYILIV
jgi:hypothetical protein